MYAKFIELINMPSQTFKSCVKNGITSCNFFCLKSCDISENNRGRDIEGGWVLIAFYIFVWTLCNLRLEILPKHLKYYFESHLIYENTIISIFHIYIISLFHSVTILWEIYMMRLKCYVRGLRFHFKRMLIKGLGQ